MGARIVEINWSYPQLYERVFNSSRLNEIGLYCLSRKFGENEKMGWKMGSILQRFTGRQLISVCIFAENSA